jgi:6-phosphogluconolactonase/glucosamine-6-phosphate isomerase/deaminase
MKQLLDAGFILPKAQLYPVLQDENIDTTTKNYDTSLRNLIDRTNYKIGLFGMGPDGHIAALFPHHSRLSEDELYATYLKDSPKLPQERMTMTIAAIKKLDEAVLFVRGSERKELIAGLNTEIDIREQPAQILKQVPKLTIFNDQIGEEI